MRIDEKENISVFGALSVNTFLIFINLLSFQQLVNASCILSDGQIGKCVKFDECLSAVILSQKGVNPGFCSLEEGIVCCNEIKNTGQTEIRSRPSTNRKDSYQDDFNFQRKKHSVGLSSNENFGRKTANADFIEEPYKYETPSIFYSVSEVTNKPIRQPFRPRPNQNEDSYFVPPGHAKKKWRDEKTTEDDFSYEYLTKKPAGSPHRKGPNKHTVNGYEFNEFEDEYTNVKPNRRPQTTSSSDRPNYQGSSVEGNKRPDNHLSPNYQENRPNNQQGSYFGGNQPNNQQSPNFGGNRPNNQQGSYFGGNQQNSNFGGNRPNNQQGSYFGGNQQNSNFGGNRPNNQQGSYFGGNQPNNQQNSNFGENRPNSQQSSNFGGNQPNNQQSSGVQGNKPNSRPELQSRKRISERKCEEYSRQITEHIAGLPLTTDPDPVIIPVRKCITPQQLIVGGENTTLGEFPHMAAIGFRDRSKKQIAWNCGGTLISELYVMTAAHCTSTSSGRPVKVRLGEYNLKKSDDGAYPVDYTIVEIITHPEYKPPSKYNDIALLKLSREVKFLKHIRPACLYSEEIFSAPKAIATGWGRIYYDGDASEILQKVVLSIVDNHTCNRLYKVNIKTEVLSRGIVDSQLCAGELTGGKDTCQGDSGGPLSITSSKCIHHVIGVTSFGKSCALPNSTGVYTRVSAYVPWIESVIWPTYHD